MNYSSNCQNMKPVLSIIIPAYNSESTIGKCISSITRQKHPRENYMIIVIDDASSDHTIEQAKTAGADIVISLKNRQRAAHARNIGVKQASSDLLAFIDSDCEAEEGWINTIFEELKTVQAITGPIDNGNSQSVKAWAEYLIEFGSFHKYRKRATTRFLNTCNGACTKKALLKVGGFIEVQTGEDVILGGLFSKTGIEIFYIPELRIKHMCRVELKKILTNTKKLGRGLVITRTIDKSIPYKKFIRSRLFIPLIFFGKLVKSFSYAKQGKNLNRFFVALPFLLLGLISFCIGIWQEIPNKELLKDDLKNKPENF